MTSIVLPRKPVGALTLDICYPCQCIWFDEFESLQLAPAGVLELFQCLHAHRNDQRQPWHDALQCPRCDERMVTGQDITKNGRFSYHRCLQQHGRLNSFGAFFQEKGFVRQLSGAEISSLAKQVQTIRCSGCGAPVDICREQVCSHCHAPIVVLDADAVNAALAGYRAAAEKQAKPSPDALAEIILANERAKSRETMATRNSSDASDLVDVADLLVDGVSFLWQLIKS